MSQREHYAALDGLRGLASVSVVLFHIGHWLNAPFLAADSDLAVDFFFCLSGFVLALAYDKRFREGSTGGQFMRIRIIRLMPLIMLGTVVSSLYVVCRVYVLKTPISTQGLALATSLGLMNIPFLNAPISLGGPQVFPLNGPQYSLFLEIVVNLLWSALRTCNQLWLSLGLFTVCLVTLMFVGLGGDTADTFWLGFPRVTASFFAGVAVYHLDLASGRSNVSGKIFWFVAAVTLLFFYFPYPLSLPFKSFWIASWSPLLVYTGSKTRLTGKTRLIALLGGELSYPVYALHYPIFCWINGAFQVINKQQNVVLETPLILAGVLLGSYFSLKSYDEPLRKWLSHRATRPIATRAGTR